MATSTEKVHRQIYFRAQYAAAVGALPTGLAQRTPNELEHEHVVVRASSCRHRLGSGVPHPPRCFLVKARVKGSLVVSALLPAFAQLFFGVRCARLFVGGVVMGWRGELDIKSVFSDRRFGGHRSPNERLYILLSFWRGGRKGTFVRLLPLICVAIAHLSLSRRGHPMRRGAGA